LTLSLYRRGCKSSNASQDSIGANVGDRKCLGKLRTSLVGLLNAKVFRRVSGERVFQQPRVGVEKIGHGNVFSASSISCPRSLLVISAR
jgi:hypothetical protein